MSKNFVLASSSPYRLALIKTYALNIDESILQDESTYSYDLISFTSF
ncbi:hypothetical protein [Cysteiniphilum sp. 19S12-1]